MTKPILTCRIFRGTSCLWINARHSRCIGINPNGLGLRLRLRQYEDPNPWPGGYALAGDRNPFASPFGAPFETPSFVFLLVGFAAVTAGISGFAPEEIPPFAVILVGLRSICGLLLLLLARESSGSISSWPSPCSSIGSTELKRCVFDRVVGGKYPSFPLVSEGVGEGDITRGVLGT